MFENYVEEQQTLLPYLRMCSKQFPTIEIPKIGIYGYNWDESRVKHNVGKWWEEIKICSKDIQYAYCFSKAYNDLIKRYLDDMDSQLFPRGYELRSFELHFWITCLLNCLHSFREKIAHLLLDLYDQSFFYSVCGKQELLIHNKVTYFKVLDALKKYNNSISWISKEDHQELLSAFKSLCQKEMEDIIKIRHAFVHGARLSIDTIGTGPIITGGDPRNDDEFTIYFQKDETYSYQQIEEQFDKAWYIMCTKTSNIASLGCFT